MNTTLVDTFLCQLQKNFHAAHLMNNSTETLNWIKAYSRAFHTFAVNLLEISVTNNLDYRKLPLCFGTYIVCIRIYFLFELKIKMQLKVKMFVAQKTIYLYLPRIKYL